MTPFEKAKYWLTKARFGIAQWRGGRIPVAFLGHDHSNGAKVEFGATLSGGEFTPGGTYPNQYGYPEQDNIIYYAAQGMRVIRFPVLWERVQPFPYGDLDELEMTRIKQSMGWILDAGMKIAFDIHNGGYGYGAIIGNHDCPDARFENLWAKLANRFKHIDPNKLLFMIMSEPHDQCERQWFRSAQVAIDAIRSTGAPHTIVVPGTFFDGGWTWTLSNNADYAESLFDPQNNLMFEAHQYLDADASGGTSGIVRESIGADRLYAMTQWARENGFRLFLGEFGTDNDDVSMRALNHMLNFLADNADVWKYACWWGAGPRFNDYFMSLEPRDGMKALQLFAIQTRM